MLFHFSSVRFRNGCHLGCDKRKHHRRYCTLVFAHLHSSVAGLGLLWNLYGDIHPAVCIQRGPEEVGQEKSCASEERRKN